MASADTKYLTKSLWCTHESFQQPFHAKMYIKITKILIYNSTEIWKDYKE